MYVATQLYSCPYCGSQDLVWDYRAGIVVCSSCGSVVDAIYDLYSHLDGDVEHGNTKRSGYRFSYVPKSLTEIGENRKRVELVEKKIRSRRVIEALPKDIKKICEYGMEIAHKVSPSLIEGKSLRSRYAVGYMLYRLLMGKPIDAEEVSKTFKVSISTVRRLAKSVAHRVGLIKQPMC